MAIQVLTKDWRRFHDPEGDITAAGATIHCVEGLTSIIEVCRDRPANTRYKATGSHWALSAATVSDDEFIETNWPLNDGVPRHSGLDDVDLFDIIDDNLFEFMATHPSQTPKDVNSDPCLTEEPVNFFFVHLRSGTRVYAAYSLLDGATGDTTKLAKELNSKLVGSPTGGPYDGPWGFRTLGGAGGQTVFGALTTGTHGGDYRQRPISDSVVAVHLVTDGGAHFWIEPASGVFGQQLTDDGKLNARYKDLVPADPNDPTGPKVPFEIIRDDDIFNAVTVGVGRFGVVASFVARVVPQYSLLEHRRLDNWPDVKKLLNGASHHRVFDTVHFAGDPVDMAADIAAFEARFQTSFKSFSNRFLQIALNLSPDGNGSRLCGITQRWFYPQSGGEATDPNGEVRGRKERGTPTTAGIAAAYVPPDDDSGAGGNSTFLTRACSSGNFIAGVLRETANEIEEAIADGALPAAGIAVGALAIGAGAVALAIVGLCAILALVALALKELADAIEASGDASLAGSMDAAINTIVNNPAIPRELAIMIIRAIFYAAFKSQQGKRDFVALSYAVMDTHDYTDRSCFSNAESIEVFFDAHRPDLYCAYVDAILAFEAAQQEQQGLFSVGYVSLRYVQGSRALIAPARFDDTVVMEIAGLRDASGSVPFVMNAAKIARKPIFNASFHWGQFNPLERAEVEKHFDAGPNGKLERWRLALEKLTNGSDGFSSDFTRHTGLEPS